MKRSTAVMMALALGLAAFNSIGQDADQAPRRDPPGGPQDGPRPPGGPGRDGFRPPIGLLEQALDTDHDGIISAEEMANAPAALKKLDKNGDGKLTPEEFRPMRRPGGPQGGPRGAGQGFERDGQGPGNPPPGDPQGRPGRRPAAE